MVKRRYLVVASFFVFGQVAVMVFFVISGFVIYHSTYRHRSASFRAYITRRFLRIHPQFQVALAITYAVACIRDGSLLPVELSELAGNVFMLQDAIGKERGRSRTWTTARCGR